MKKFIYILSLVTLLCSFANDSFAQKRHEAGGKVHVNRHDRQQASVDKKIWEQYLPEGVDNRNVGIRNFDLLSPANGYIEVYAVWYGGQIEQYAKYQFEIGIEVDGKQTKVFEGKEDTSTPSSDPSKWSSNPGFAASVTMDPTNRFRLYIKYVDDNGKTVCLYSDDGNATLACTYEFNANKKWQVIGFEDQPESKWAESKPDFNDVILYVLGAEQVALLESKRFFCEDEGATGDFDYNDIVFDVRPLKDHKIAVDILALGSTIPVELSVAGRVVMANGETDLHKIFNTGYKPFNVGDSYMKEPKTFIVDGDITNLAPFTDVMARVTDGNGTQRIVRHNAVSAKGEAIIGVPAVTKWLKEGIKIKHGYPKFFYGDWYNYPVDEFDEYLVDLDSIAKGDCDMPQGDCILADGWTFNDIVRPLLKSDCAIEFKTGSNNTSSTIISADDSPVKAYASYDSSAKVLYIYTSAEEFVAPADFCFAFSDMSGLTEVRNIATVNTENVKNMYGMFQYCTRLSNLDLSGWNTANVTNMRNMFYRCSAFTSLDLSCFNTTNVVDMRHMFDGCDALQAIYCWNTECPSNVSEQVLVSFDDLSTTLYVPKESLESYKSHKIWGRFGTIIGLTLQEFQTMEKAELDTYIDNKTGGVPLVASVIDRVNTYKANIDATTSYADTELALRTAKAAVDGHNHNQEVVGFVSADSTQHLAYCSAEGICTGAIKEQHSYAEDRSDGEAYYTCFCGHIDLVRQHVHNYSEEWYSDSTHHWHECTAEGTCTAPIIGKAEHTIQGTILCDADNYQCEVCKHVDEEKKALFAAERDYFCLKAVDGDVTLGMSKTGMPDECILQISEDGNIWCEPMTVSESTDNIVTIPSGETRYLRRGSTTATDKLSSDYSENYWSFTMTGSGNVEADGNIMSLFDMTCQQTTMTDNAFTQLFVGCTQLKTVTIKCQALMDVAYNMKDVFGSNVTTYVIGNGVTSIGDNAFGRNSAITSVTIPEGITSIGNQAFVACSGLTSIVIPSTVDSIGSQAFSRCGNITEYTLNCPSTCKLGNNAIPTTGSYKIIVQPLTTHSWTTNPMWDTYGAHFSEPAFTLHATEDPDKAGYYYTTFYNSHYAYTIPDSVKAYTADYQLQRVILTPIDGNVLPKGTAVLLHSTVHCDMEMVINNDAIDDANDNNIKNKFEGVDASTPQDSTYRYYTLSNGDNGLCFYSLDETMSLPANVALLPLPSTTKATSIQMLLPAGPVTIPSDIENVNDESHLRPAQDIYNLQGIRLNSLHKGINIVNGKKIVVK